LYEECATLFGPLLNGKCAKASAIVLMFALIGAAPPAEAPLAPAGKWTIDYAGNFCVLQHSYGMGDAAVTLGLKPSPFGDAKAEFVLLMPRSGRAMENGKAVVTLPPLKRSIDADYQSFDLDSKSRVTSVWVDQPALAGLDTATEIAITAGKNSTIRVAPPAIAKALAALQACENDLLKSWGFDPEVLANVATLPQPIKPETWYRNDDYPTAARRANAQGITTIAYSVGIDGTISGCRTIISSENSDLDQAACNLTVSRGRHTPAIGKDGKPVATFASRRVAWKLIQPGG
jgi:TonB family protein